jgi:hypothetical protein
MIPTTLVHMAFAFCDEVDRFGPTVRPARVTHVDLTAGLLATKTMRLRALVSRLAQADRVGADDLHDRVDGILVEIRAWLTRVGGEDVRAPAAQTVIERGELVLSLIDKSGLPRPAAMA